MTYETWISGSMTPYEVVIPIILVIYILILSGYEACILINHRSRNLSNDRHIQEAISNRHTSLSQGDIDTNNYFSSAFTCTGTGGWAPTVAAQRINGCAAAGPHASMAQKLRRPAARPASTSSQTSGDAGGRASAAGKVRAAPCRPDRGTRRQGRSSQES